MQKEKDNYLQKTWVVCLLAMVCCVLWGSAFPSIKIGYELFEIASADTAAQILFAGIRFTLAGILTILIGSLLGRTVLVPKRSSLGMILKLCMFQTVIQYFFFYVGLANTTGVKASIIEATNVFVAMLISCLVYKYEKAGIFKMAGCLIGFIGVVAINLNGSGLDMAMKLNGEGFIFLSTVSYAFSSVIIKRYSQKENPVVLSGYQFVLGGLIMAVCGFATGGRITVIYPKALLLLVYLAMISAVAYSIWGILLKYNPVGKVAVFGFMNPVSGVILSAVFLGEKNQAFTLQGLFSLVLVCLGIYLVNVQKN